MEANENDEIEQKLAAPYVKMILYACGFTYVPSSRTKVLILLGVVLLPAIFT